MINRIERVIGTIAAILMFVLMATTLADVAGRNLFNHPLPGGSDISEILLVTIAFLLFPQVALREKHIIADLIDSLDNRFLHIIRYVGGGICGAVLFGMIGWRVWILGQDAIGYGDVTAALRIPVGPIFLVVAVLSVVCALAFIVTIGRAARPIKERKGATEHINEI